MSPKIRKTIAHLRSLSGAGQKPVTISLSAEALQVLVAGAHTIAVEAVGEDGYHHACIYTVSPQGMVLAESEVRVPMPNETQWSWPNPTPGRRLETLKSSHSLKS